MNYGMISRLLYNFYDNAGLPARVKFDVVDCVMLYCSGLDSAHESKITEENKNTNHDDSACVDVLAESVRNRSTPSMRLLGYTDLLPLQFLNKIACQGLSGYIPSDSSGWPPTDALHMAIKGPDCAILFMAWKRS